MPSTGMAYDTTIHQKYKYIVTQNMLQSVLQFGPAKFAYGGSVLGSSQFTLLPQLPLN